MDDDDDDDDDDEDDDEEYLAKLDKLRESVSFTDNFLHFHC